MLARKELVEIGTFAGFVQVAAFALVGTCRVACWGLALLGNLGQVAFAVAVLAFRFGLVAGIHLLAFVGDIVRVAAVGLVGTVEIDLLGTCQVAFVDSKDLAASAGIAQVAVGRTHLTAFVAGWCLVGIAGTDLH